MNHLSAAVEDYKKRDRNRQAVVVIPALLLLGFGWNLFDRGGTSMFGIAVMGAGLLIAIGGAAAMDGLRLKSIFVVAEKHRVDPDELRRFVRT